MKKIEELLGGILISDFNWRNLRIFVSVVIASIAGLYVYEYYTATFELGRLQKSADLMARLQEIQAHGTNRSPILAKAQETLMTEATAVIDQKPLTLTSIWAKRSCLPDPVVNFIISTIPFLILALILFPKKSQQRITSLAGVLIGLALFSGFMGSIAGNFMGPWFLLLGLPSLVFSTFFILILPSNLRVAKQTANRNRCINNLHHIVVAKNLWAVDHKESVSKGPTVEELLPYLGNELRVTKCPCGGTYNLGKISDVPTCSHEGHSLNRN